MLLMQKHDDKSLRVRARLRQKYCVLQCAYLQRSKGFIVIK